MPLTMLDYKKLYQEKHHRTQIYRFTNRGMDSLSLWAKYLPLSGSVVELGCGNGKLCRYLGCTYDVTGIDIAGSYDRSGYTYIKCDITKQLPFEDRHFDVGLCFDVLEHLGEPVEVTRELERISKKQIISVSHAPSEDSRLHVTVQSPEWWMGHLADGWRLVKTTDRGNNKTGFYTASLIARNCNVGL